MLARGAVDGAPVETPLGVGPPGRSGAGGAEGGALTRPAGGGGGTASPAVGAVTTPLPGVAPSGRAPGAGGVGAPL